jgi:hypothetical protein
MPQMMLPIFPAGVTEINDKLAFKKEDGVVTYLLISDLYDLRSSDYFDHLV